MTELAQIALTVESLGCVRGGRSIFQDISFSMSAGQLLAVTGPNGAGKSSLLRILAGLLRPAGGHFAVLPHDDDFPPAHYLGHLDGLKDVMSLHENLAFWCNLYSGTADGNAIADAAERFGLGHALTLPVGVFSAGQRRRAGLARLTLTPRPLWLLDEPTAALDRQGEAELGDVMQAHLSAGGVIVAATHLDLPVKPDLTLAMVPA